MRCYPDGMNIADKINLAIAIISGLSVVVSVGVCVATYRILRATRDTLALGKEQMHAARRPYIDVSAQPDTEQGVIILRIQNSGASAATRVQLSMDQDFFLNGEEHQRNIREMPVFTEVMDSLAPHASTQILLGVGWAIYQRPAKAPHRFNVTARYSFEGREFVETSLIDLRAFEGHSIMRSPQLKALEKITESTGAMARHLQTLAQSPGVQGPQQAEEAAKEQRLEGMRTAMNVAPWVGLCAALVGVLTRRR